jgi:triacylglycerol lipase
MTRAPSPFLLRHPVVLIHGLGAQHSFGPVDYFYGLPPRLRDAGTPLLIARLPIFHSIASRAQALRDQIEAAFPAGQKVNLVGHSLGGLDARYFARTLDPDRRVASVTTIGTPNAGTGIADLVLKHLPGPAFEAANRLMGALGGSLDAFREISPESMGGEFGARLARAPGVAYFSATSIIPKSYLRHALPTFWIPHHLLKRLEGDNDGFVSEASARWGEHILTATGDHYAQIGHFLGRTRGLDYAAFYEAIFERLRREGF